MTASTTTNQQDVRTTGERRVAGAMRAVVVIDRDLPAGLAANTAALLALTLGAVEPGLRGRDFTDGSGEPHHGLYGAGLPVLAAPAARFVELRRCARERGVHVIDLPSAGHRTNDYDAFLQTVAGTSSTDLSYAGVALYGPAKLVRSLTGGLPLLR